MTELPMKYRENRKIATVPYNFISLCKFVCPPHPMWEELGSLDNHSKRDIQSTYREYLKSSKQVSGYIDLDITTKTETLVGGSQTEREDGKKESSFFTLDGVKPIIPGSSLRGMIRNIFKIVTAGTFIADEDYTNKKLYYRDVASKNIAKELKNEYSNAIQKKNKDTMRRGFLVKLHKGQDSYWKIYEDTYSDSDKNIRANTDDLPSGYVDWDDIEINGKVYAIVECIDQNKDDNKYVFHTSAFGNPTILNVPEQVIKDYFLDTCRTGRNVLKDHVKEGVEAETIAGNTNIDFVSPCFFTASECTVLHFGASPFYRIPYNRDIKYHVPEKLQENVVDFTDVVFGKKEYWKGRVFFSDGQLKNPNQGTPYTMETKELTLLGPKPTSYQFYLDQSKEGDRLHWNNDVDIHGVKYYWHRDVTTTENNGNDKVATECRNIVKPGVTFTSRVYFKDLSEIELGALCKVLFMGTGISESVQKGSELTRNNKRQFKLGKGKSIGMGSVSITAQLILESDDAYINPNMWSDTGINNIYESISPESDVDAYIAAFDQYTKEILSDEKNEKIDELLRSLESLYLMMDPEVLDPHTNIKTNMMKIDDNNDNRFTNRTALLDVRRFIDAEVEG